MLFYGQRPVGSFPLGAVPDGSLVGKPAEETSPGVYVSGGGGGGRGIGYTGRTTITWPDAHLIDDDMDVAIFCSVFLEVIQ